MAHSSSAMRRFNHLVSETDAVYHEVSARLGLSDSVMQILYILYDFPDGRCALQEICRWMQSKDYLTNHLIIFLLFPSLFCSIDAGSHFFL